MKELLRLVAQVIKSFAKLILKPRGSYSQYGEDTIVRTLLPQKSGFYVDIGAYHPHLYSNTYLLYRRGWSGVAIDPNPLCEKLFSFFRPRDTFIRCGVGNETTGLYYSYSDGAYNGFAPAQAHSGVLLLETIPTPIRPLSKIVPQEQRVDFLSIDVEGMDVEVLKSWDWSRKPSLIAVEGTRGGAAEVFLIEKGYTLHIVAGKSLIFAIL